jgi:hypothetical protein
MLCIVCVMIVIVVGVDIGAHNTFSMAWEGCSLLLHTIIFDIPTFIDTSISIKIYFIHCLSTLHHFPT